MMADQPETRSIEDSFSHAHDAAGRAEHLISLIVDDLNGNAPGSMGVTQPGSPMGLVNSADRLAGRLESLCRELEGIRAKLVSNSPKSIAQLNNGANAQNQAGYASRLG